MEIMIIPIEKCLLSLFLCYLTSSFLEAGQESVSSAGASIELTENERRWLAAHQEIKLAPDPEFLPIEYINENGEYLGIAADFVALVEEKLEINFTIIGLENWDEVLEKTKARQVDMWGAATPTPQRLEYMLFTEPFIDLPAVIIVRKKIQESLSLESLRGRNVAVISGYGIHDYLVDNHPELHLEVVPDISEGLKKVSFGKVDAMVVNIGLATYYIEKDGITNLKVAGTTKYKYHWGFASRNDWPELNRILQKGIDMISEEEKIEIYRKWVGLKMVSSLQVKDILIPVLISLGVFAVVGILISNLLLKKQVQRRTNELQKELIERERVEKMLTGYNGVLEMMAVGHSLQDIMDALVGLIQQQYSEMICCILLLDESRGKLLLGSAPSLPAEYNKAVHEIAVGPNVGSCGTAAFFNKTIIVKNIAFDPLWKDYKDFALKHCLKACWSTPIHNSKGRPLGVYAVYYKEARGPTDKELEIVKSSADIAGIAIERKRRDDELVNAKVSAEMANRAKSEFLANISHELRTPLHGILSFAGFGIKKYASAKPKKLLDYFRQIDQSGRTLLSLLDDLLDLAKLESGKLNFELKPTSISTITETVIDEFRARILDSKLTIDRNGFSVENDEIVVDPERIQQVLRNLISNAVKFSPKNGTINVTMNRDGDLLTIAVQDMGVGIPENELEAVFDKFVQSTKTKTGAGGTGLGLSICKEIINAHKGRIWAENTDEGGAKFSFEIPTDLEKTSA